MSKTSLYEEICSERREVNTSVLKQVVSLAVEIAREGREGRKIGTLFVVGDSGEVVRRSKPMILDPLQGHPDEDKYVDDPNMRETVKELAQLDGAFVVSNAGVVLSAARYIDAASGMPFMHAENVREYAVGHREIVERFGRFPHRNAILGRETTPEEAEFLTQPRSSF